MELMGDVKQGKQETNKENKKKLTKQRKGFYTDVNLQMNAFKSLSLIKVHEL